MTIEVVPCTQSGCVDLRDARYPEDGVLHMAVAEWAEFLAVVKRGDFDELPRKATPVRGGPPQADPAFLTPPGLRG